MIRLFTALEIPAEIANRLEDLQSGLPGARWIERENFHLTLRFMGDIPEPQADDLHAELWEVEAHPFEIQLEGIGQFGKAKPHAVWAGVRMTPELKQLQLRHEAAARRAGLDPEPRKFTPHVTIARCRGADPVDVMRYVTQTNPFRPESFEVTEFVLFSSRAHQGGGPYVPECVYPFR